MLHFHVKRIDSYLFKSFISLLFITFFVCLFVVIMQFVWLHIDDLVGKGVPLNILAEFFLYAALSSMPIALPLAILLASLMTFGNLSERLELLAMKSGGISLFRIMRSLLIFISLVVIGAFFFSNNVLPFAQKKMWTLMFSFRHKSPELEIPVGEFYSGIKGMNIYVRSKDQKTKALCDVMLYDYSNGFDNASVTTADSVWVQLTADKKNLLIILKNGEYFENLSKQGGVNRRNIPYRREEFAQKELLIDFDANFNLLDEDLLADQHVSKNLIRLTHDIDSINHLRDSMRVQFSTTMVQEKYFQRIYTPAQFDTVTVSEPSNRLLPSPDSLFLTASQEQMLTIARHAVTRAQTVASDMQFYKISIENADTVYVRHAIELHLKFTLSFACLIFFFIGAPLGAIIGKGGLGVPAVASIGLFIVYYIINTFGQKMARETLWDVWQGMWLSSAVLLPIGIFFTYKAATDSTLFNAETYQKFFTLMKTESKTFIRKMTRRLNNRSNRESL
ncbi:MAG: LptF/LptG family permease [Prevotellaceae bacterium]|jgi:lipopolysaccharide export system permease protein|nr:LptF/LptG family permease [Prevotellaceae bacterium]